MTNSSCISYGHTDSIRSNYKNIIIDTIISNDYKKIGDLGGGANPLLSEKEITEMGIDYTVIDISQSELNKAPQSYKKIQADLSSKNLSISESFDFAFSNQLIEHVKNAEKFHTNIFNILSKDGSVIHHFPTLFAPPFVLNFVLPERIGYIIVNLLQNKKENRREI